MQKICLYFGELDSVFEDHRRSKNVGKCLVCTLSPEAMGGFIANLHIYILLRARRNEKELKVKPAISFKYFQYLLTKN